jgi:SOS-response transcriptional repressor LexA
MEKIRMTQREQVVYDYILKYRKEKRFSPSMREIAEGIGLHSASTVHVHIHNLIKKGWFLPCEQLNRTIIPAEEGL